MQLNDPKESSGSSNLTFHVAVLIKKTFENEAIKDDSTSTITVIQMYVIINSISFKIESNDIIEAVDDCYKAFSQLNLNFTPECKKRMVIFNISVLQK